MADDSKIKLSDIDVVKAYNEELDKSKELLNGMSKEHKATNKVLLQIQKRLKSNTDQGEIAQKNAKQSAKLGGTILKIKQAQNKGDKLGQAIQESKLKFQRFFTKDLSKSNQTLLKIFDKEKDIEKSKGNQVDLSEEVGSALSGQIPMAKELGFLFSKKAGFLKKAVAFLAIGGTILKSFAARTKVIGDEFGALGMQSGEFKNPILSASTNARRLGMDTKEVAEVTKELTTNFGFTNLEAANLSLKVLDTSRALGLSSSEGSKLFGTLINIGGLSAETAEQFSESAAQLARANGAAPTVVLKDLANSSETIAKFTGMTPDNLAKAAIQANKLGLSLKDIGGVAESLLDFQGSLNKEIEASVLLGRDINLQKARELALNNDLEGVAIEITKQVGGEAEFNKLNLIQRKALAESIGLSVEQLSKVVTNQDKVKSINDAIAGTDTFGDLLGRDSLDNITKIVNDFKAIGSDLVNTIGPTISSIVGGIASFTKMISESAVGTRVLIGLVTTLMTRSIATAIAGLFFKSSFLPGLGIALALGSVAAMTTSISSAKTIGLKEGAILKPTKGGIDTTIAEGGQPEAVIPIEKLAKFFKDAVSPLVEENRQLREVQREQTAAIKRVGEQTAMAIGDL